MLRPVSRPPRPGLEWWECTARAQGAAGSPSGPSTGERTGMSSATRTYLAPPHRRIAGGGAEPTPCRPVRLGRVRGTGPGESPGLGVREACGLRLSARGSGTRRPRGGAASERPPADVPREAQAGAREPPAAGALPSRAAWPGHMGEVRELVEDTLTAAGPELAARERPPGLPRVCPPGPRRERERPRPTVGGVARSGWRERPRLPYSLARADDPAACCIVAAGGSARTHG